MGQHAKALLVTQRARSAVDVAARKLAEATAALENPPKIESVTDAIMDDSLRRSYERATGPERARLDDMMASGKAPELVRALARMPAVFADAAKAQNMHRALARKADPVAVGHLDAAAERLSWAETWLREVNGALDSATLSGVVEPSSTVVTA